ncbi:OmpA family protein [Pseudoalteromonas sp. SR44-5]|jgi:outer membrane protein OmpA-like peptidoglycan-associated protein|uniref:OmpA family protein n=2 Tax=Pseudoalteromonas TaxID=53246 RepID=A0ABY3FE45_9GAMM|nr:MULTISPECIES: OmpA family protein [Pseudoalteromonas]MBB1295114.1 OmpA family protein [Pseudoalteromonas sp. SR41-4]MBB1300730.1 OmpA family protein [Pseudoalteromonas sp. SR44-8]MBB1332663.1 OmpA family protein [Pseudoalteromonas sp. SR41-6]MBB1342942.1 OmpA family protein [Pseudoalteromonas sp. SR45-6]MBB1364969.1 OmpA family protein [Pseudoalteromonas sp. SR44-5]|tara:strand:- start:20404 stop:21282 length:879 start_codon:yes stop_codon:yes gene_type:complete
MKLSMLFISLSIATACLSDTASAAMRQYTATADNSQWEVVKTTRLQCQLNHEVPYYGEAIFSATASKNKDLLFNLDMVVRPDNYSIAGLKAVPPIWRAGLPARDIADMKLLRKFDGELGNKTAWEMLTELEKGYQPTFYYQDWQNSADKIAVGLSNINFKQAYWAFLQCRDELLPYSFEDISFTIMNYQPNTSKLTKSSKQRLDKIAEYLKYDTTIAAISIDSYTDSYGGRWNNLELSKKRAQAIKEYMVSLGIDETKVETQGFGEKRHVATNDNILGRDKNRRLVIQIEKM